MRWIGLAAAGSLFAACSGGGQAQSAPTQAVAGQLHIPELSVGEVDPEAVPPRTLACYDRGPGDYIDAIEREEGTRGFRIHVPPTYDGQQLVPAMFNFHGQVPRPRRAAAAAPVRPAAPALPARSHLCVFPRAGGAAERRAERRL